MELFWLILSLSCIGLYCAQPMVGGNQELKSQAADLVREFRNGEREAFNRLVLLYQSRMYNLALNYVKDQEEARDLTQDIFVTVFRALPQLKEEDKFSAWLYQVAINHCRNRYRKLKSRGYFSSQSLDDPNSSVELRTDRSPDRDAEKMESIRLVRTVIASMSAAEKEILLLRDVQELSYEEIAEVLEMPLGTVKSKLNRARISFANKIKHYL